MLTDGPSVLKSCRRYGFNRAEKGRDVDRHVDTKPKKPTIRQKSYPKKALSSCSLCQVERKVPKPEVLPLWLAVIRKHSRLHSNFFQQWVALCTWDRQVRVNLPSGQSNHCGHHHQGCGGGHVSFERWCGSRRRTRCAQGRIYGWDDPSNMALG